MNVFVMVVGAFMIVASMDRALLNKEKPPATWVEQSIWLFGGIAAMLLGVFG
jgi:hypothetical membrane protein